MLVCCEFLSFDLSTAAFPTARDGGFKRVGDLNMLGELLLAGNFERKIMIVDHAFFDGVMLFGGQCTIDVPGNKLPQIIMVVVRRRISGLKQLRSPNNSALHRTKNL